MNISLSIHNITAHHSCSFLSQQHKHKHSSLALVPSRTTQHVLDQRKRGQNLLWRSNPKPSSSSAKCGCQLEGEMLMKNSNDNPEVKVEVEAEVAEEKEEEFSWKEMEKWVDKCKGREGMVELLECLEREAIMGDDEGRDPLDYNRRAQIFDKSSRVFQALSKEKPATS